MFLPLHFLTLGLALEGAEALDRFLAFADLPLVKAAEWGVVVLLAIHLGLGARLLVLEARSVARHAHRLDWMGGRNHGGDRPCVSDRGVT